MFELILGNVVFASAGARTQAKNLIAKYAARGTYGTDGYTVYDVPAGKYGAGPTLNVTIRFLARADADEAMADLKSVAGSLLAGTNVLQTSVPEDASHPVIVDSLIL